MQQKLILDLLFGSLNTVNLHNTVVKPKKQYHYTNFCLTRRITSLVLSWFQHQTDIIFHKTMQIPSHDYIKWNSS